jgi:DNA-binding XRE family transcriptional regulator
MLSKFIADRRAWKGYTPEELGRRVGADAQTVEAWERGEAKPAFEHLVPLARELGTTVDNLLHADRPDGPGFMVQVGPMEWVSRKKTRNGTPYIHVNQAPWGRARGLVAVGQFATGILAFGSFAKGVFAFGGIAVGIFSFGGGSVGLLVAIGGGAISLGVAIGGLAIGAVAIGGGAFGYLWALGGNTVGQ